MTSEELKRYNRHIILSEIGMEGQEKLKAARVLVIGAGGLGCPVLQYLTAAGVGTIGIVDLDKVDISNLQRQILYSTEDVGKSKAETASAKLSLQNPFVKFEVFNTRLCKENVLEIFTGFDFVIDGTDNFPSRYLINDACVILKKPLVFGSIFKFEGQVSVFNYLKDGIYGPTYRCLFPEAPPAEEVPNCSQIGVLGVLPGLIGTFQANEAIKLILGIGNVLSGKLLVLNALTMQTDILSFSADPGNYEIKQLMMDYEDFCNATPEAGSETSETAELKSISVRELHSWKESEKTFQLIDVREPFEAEICTLGGLLIPMREMQQQVDRLNTEMPVVLYCHHGMRSAMVGRFLVEEFKFTNLYNLEGGIHEWALEIDEEMERY
jgi:sulfur-carrier protein adenylyltransferase/sulfurtransferase